MIVSAKSIKCLFILLSCIFTGIFSSEKAFALSPEEEFNRVSRLNCVGLNTAMVVFQLGKNKKLNENLINEYRSFFGNLFLKTREVETVCRLAAEFLTYSAIKDGLIESDEALMSKTKQNIVDSAKRVYCNNAEYRNFDGTDKFCDSPDFGSYSILSREIQEKFQPNYPNTIFSTSASERSTKGQRVTANVISNDLPAPIGYWVFSRSPNGHLIATVNAVSDGGPYKAMAFACTAESRLKYVFIPRQSGVSVSSVRTACDDNCSREQEYALKNNEAIGGEAVKLSKALIAFMTEASEYAAPGTDLIYDLVSGDYDESVFAVNGFMDVRKTLLDSCTREPQFISQPDTAQQKIAGDYREILRAMSPPEASCSERVPGQEASCTVGDQSGRLTTRYVRGGGGEAITIDFSVPLNSDRLPYFSDALVKALSYMGTPKEQIDICLDPRRSYGKMLSFKTPNGGAICGNSSNKFFGYKIGFTFTLENKF